VALAYDPDELVDRLALADQLASPRWTPVSSLGVVTITGGYASLSMDLAIAEGINIPPLDGYREWVTANLPGVTVPNPLDATGFGAQIWPEIIEKYATDPDLDAILVVHPVADEDSASAPMIDAFALAAAKVDKPCVIANCSGVPGEWITDHLGGSLVRGRGLRGTLRGLATLGRFVAYRDRPCEVVAAEPAIGRPTPTPIPQPEGLMLPFGASMDLLAEHGIPVAPYHLVAAETDASSVRPGFSGPYVVKLADVAHRTEHDGVRLRVDQAGLAAAISDLRAIAAADGLSPAVAVQPMLEIIGETLLGIQGQSELGPLVVFGLGGIFVEALNRVSGRMAPFGLDEARSLIDEFADMKLMHGFRGRPAWDLDGLAAIVRAAGRLAAGGKDWIASLDINPLVYGPAGYQAVDALLLIEP
jgi:acyl-CoA synthetase (NDP forming)